MPPPSPAPTPDRPGALNWAIILTLGVIWGAAFMSMSIALEGFGPVTVAALRVFIAALALTSIGAVMGQGLHRVDGARAWRFMVTIGVLAVALPFAMLAWGQQFIPSAVAGVAIGAVPLLLLPLVAIFSPEEGIGPRRVIGVVLGFFGLLVLLGPEALRAFAGSVDAAGALGTLACIGAAGCYAIGSVLTRRAPKMPPLAFSAATLLAASAVLVPAALIVEGVPQSWPTRPTLWMLYAALGPTALATVMRIRVITTAGSLFMSTVGYMVPIWSVIFGIVLLGEELPPRLFTALALILIGIGIAQSRAIAASLRRKRGA